MATYQYPVRDNFCIQNLHLQNLIGPSVNPEKCRHLLDSRRTFVYGPRIFDKVAEDNLGVNSLPVREDFFDRIEDVDGHKQKILKKPLEPFDNDYKYYSTEKKSSVQGNVTCCRI